MLLIIMFSRAKVIKFEEGINILLKFVTLITILTLNRYESFIQRQ